MNFLVLEHKKRRNKGIPEHPDYKVQVDKSVYDKNSRTYNVIRKSDSKHVGRLKTDLDNHTAGKRSVYVGWAGVHGFSADSPETEAARKAGKHFLPQSVVHHVLKHVRRDYPMATRLTARRISGANKDHTVDVPLRKLNARERSKNQLGAVTKSRTSGYAYVSTSQGRATVLNFGSHTANAAGNYNLSSTDNLHIARAAKASGSKSVILRPSRGMPRTVQLDKKKVSKYYVKRAKGDHDRTEFEIHHTRKGHLASINIGKYKNTKGSTSFNATVGIEKDKHWASMPVSQKKRVYRVIKKASGAAKGDNKNIRVYSQSGTPLTHSYRIKPISR